MNRFKTSLAQNETEQKPERIEREQEKNNQTANSPAENKPFAAAVYDIFNTPPKKRGHDLSIYVTSEVWAELQKLSKQLDISKSVIVDRALREVLKIK